MLAFAPLDAATGVAYQIVTALESVTGSAALAVVAFTACLRLALLPLAYRQIRGEQTRAALLPRLKEVQDRHRDDPVRLGREMAMLPVGGVFAGVLPALVQAPFFIATYRMFLLPSIGGQHNALLTHALFGVPLGARFVTYPSLVCVGLFALLALVAWAAVRFAPVPPPPAAAGLVVRVLPFLTVVVAAFMPLAAGLYVLTTTAWTVAERRVLRAVVATR